MPKIDFKEWKGEINRYATTLAPDGFAKCATNSKLWHGILQSFPCPVLKCEKEFNIKTIVDDCDCLAFEDQVDIVDSFCGLSFMTGRIQPKAMPEDPDVSYPEIAFDKCGEFCRLGVPVPTTAPSLSAGDACNGQTSRAVYRYVNQFGQVGCPSYLSNPVCIGSGGSVGNIAIPGAEWCVTHVEIFLEMSGLKPGNKPQEKRDTHMMFVGRFPIAAAVNIDSSIASGEYKLDSEDNYPPLADLKGIIATDYALVGFSGSDIWFTKANQPNAWNGILSLSHDGVKEIRGIRYHNNRLYVGTDKYLYSFPENINEDGYSFGDPFKYGHKILPLLSSNRGMVVTQAGVMLPSTHGFILANSSKAKYITSTRDFAMDDWGRINKSTLGAVYTDYGLLFYNDGLTYMIETSDGTFDEPTLNSYRLDFNIDHAFVDDLGVLNFADGMQWFTWDQQEGTKRTFECGDDGKCLCVQCCPYHYETTDKRFEQENRMTDGVIVFDGLNGSVRLRIYDSSCRDRLLFDDTFDVNTPDCGNIQCDRKYFVMPSCHMIAAVYLVLDGCAEVRRISLGTSRSAL